MWKKIKNECFLCDSCLFFVYLQKKEAMISIIICSRKADISEELKRNISETIGVDYELIVIDNSENCYSIFSAYNEGLKSAKGDVLCFMHEDVFFHSNFWGKNVEDYFEKHEAVGMLGVAGTHYLPKMPAAWWDTEMRSGHLLQGSVVDGEYKIIQEELWDDYRREPTSVVSVDGLWMCFRKSVFSDIRWDDKNFKGFHGYDTDISLQVINLGMEVHIFWDITIEHKSVGVAKMEFYHSLDLLFEKWGDKLPIIRGVALSESEMKARMRITELRHELFYSDFRLREICQSRTYRWGQYLHNPILFFDSIKSHIKRLLRD